MITIYDIAKKSGFAPSTVSKALNNKNDVSDSAKRAILKIAHDMGYVSNQIAKNLITNRTYNIGVLLKDEMFEGYNSALRMFFLRKF